MEKRTVRVDWKRERVTKQVSIFKTDANEETRHYYKYRHVLELETSMMTGQVVVEVDLDEIVRIWGGRAARNGSGKATALHGMVKARRLNEQVVSSTKKETPIPEGYSEVKPEVSRA